MLTERQQTQKLYTSHFHGIIGNANYKDTEQISGCQRLGLGKGCGSGHRGI